MTEKEIEGPALERFMNKVVFIPFHECWQWIGTTKSYKYGGFRLNGLFIGAHRASWILFHGAIPKGEGWHGTCVCHKCDNPLCVNPRHLFLGSNRDNALDMVRKGRNRFDRFASGSHSRAKTHCPKGHAYSGENLKIKDNKRWCNTCLRERARKYWHAVGKFRAAYASANGGE
jgi:hypothetical protein